MASGTQCYLSSIELTLVRNGQPVVTAHYHTAGLNPDRFARASQKLDALVGRMVRPRTLLETRPDQPLG